MPNYYDREAFEEAIKNKNQDQIRMLLNHQDDAKKFLLTKNDYGLLPIHHACFYGADKSCLQLILDAGVQHGVAKEMFEEKDRFGLTCPHLACRHDLVIDALRLLLEYLAKHADIKKVLEAKDNECRTCLHEACHKQLSTNSLRLLLEYLAKHTGIKEMLEETDINSQTCLHHACKENLSLDSLRLLISFFPSKNLLATVLAAKDRRNLTPVVFARAERSLHQLIADPDCFEKSRLWLFLHHQDTFLYSLYPNSFEKTCDALKELTKNGLQETPERLTVMLIALMPSPSSFREAVDKTDSLAPMARYFDVVKKGDKQSDYNHWRKNIYSFRELCGQWPPSERKTASTYEGEGSSSCSIQ